MFGRIIIFILILLLLSASGYHTFTQEVTERPSWILSAVMDGTATPTGPFQAITAIDLDSEGNLYILDNGRNRILKYMADGRLIKEIGGFGSSQDRFNDPRDLDAHLTLNIFVADYNNNRIVRFDSHLNYLNDFETAYDNPFYFEMPLSVAVNNQYDLFILDDLDKRIVKFDRFNQPLASFGKASENLGQLLGPWQVTMGNKNEIFVSDPLAKSIVIFDYLGNYLREIVHPDFIEPRGIDVSSQGRLLIADTKGQCIYFYNTDGNFQEIFDLKPFDISPTDVALWHPRGTHKAGLFVSTTEKCLLFLPR